MNNNSIKAVYDDDLSDLLNSLGVLNDIQAGKHTCIYCGNVITLDNLDSIIPLNNCIRFSCNQPTCKMKLLAKENLDESK